VYTYIITVLFSAFVLDEVSQRTTEDFSKWLESEMLLTLFDDDFVTS